MPTKNGRQNYEYIAGKEAAEQQNLHRGWYAAILGIAKSTAYRLVNSGEFKTIRIGYAIRISRKSFEDWLAMEEPEGETE